ncbi:MAG: methyltransferase domain-containing protein [Hymenobacteraceae bacterium]|nr:methyltransferase domain-containing protein [Hymenobacteraceae bacterium]MDX5482720.1 methyltransferase domain-containing protein [Hymenobacteraceae bacterium]
MNYLPKLFKTGAIRETPRRIIARIADEVSFSPGPATVVELGAGLGEITKPVINKAKDKDKLSYFAFEIDEESCQHLRRHFPQVQVISESAFEFEENIPASADIDYFISSIPLSFYKKEMIEDFLEKAKARLKPDGKLIVLFSALWLIPIFKKHLPGMKLESFFTFPPYFVVVYKHRR